MSENLFQTYLNYLDAGYLFQLWERGATFTQQDWVSFTLISVNLAIAFFLSHLLVKKWTQSRTSASLIIAKN